MPRFDGTGPQGNGPFTGRGQGNCATYVPQAVPPRGTPPPFRGQPGMGMQRGNGRGHGRGFGSPRARSRR